MALVSVASAKGSPGVSTTALALAARWPGQCLLADLDPAGGDVALRYRDEDGDPLDTDRGLLSLGVAVRRGTESAQLADHLQRLSGGLDALVGVSSPSQVQGLGAAWGHVGRLLARQPEADVIADCGRVVPGSATIPVLQASDVVLFVTDSSLEQVAHLRERIRNMADVLRPGDVDGIPVAVAVIASYRDTRAAADLQQLLDSARLPVTVLGVIADEPRSAHVLRTGHGRIGRGSLLLRSVDGVVDKIRELGRLHAQRLQAQD